MYRIIGRVLVVLLAMAAPAAEDKPKDKDKPATPAEQYQALLEELQKAWRAFIDADRAAKTPEEREKAIEEKFPKGDQFAPKFLALAEKNPKDPIALDALIWVVTAAPRMVTSSSGSEVRAKAIDLLIRDHIRSAKLGRTCLSLSSRIDKGSEALLRAVLDKNPSKDIQAEACLSLAQSLHLRAFSVKRIGEKAELARSYERFFGKDVFEELKKVNSAEVEAETKRVFQEFADKHVAQLPPERLMQLCPRLARSWDEGGEYFLRTLMEKDSRREVRGVACLSLAQALKKRADGMTAADAEKAKKLRRESDKLFERAADEYADVKLDFYGTVGAKAKSELFDQRYLSVGKPAPEIVGEDQDGKKFKLSDYAGKVVLLDFWSRY
jgi:hypothetical protein